MSQYKGPLYRGVGANEISPGLLDKSITSEFLEKDELSMEIG